MKINNVIKKHLIFKKPHECLIINKTMGLYIIYNKKLTSLFL